MLTYAFGTASDGIYLHTRRHGKLYNLKRLRAKTKVTCVLIRESLGSTIFINQSLDVEINARIGKVATVIAKLKKGLAEHQSDNEYQTQSLSRLCNQHTPLRK